MFNFIFHWFKRKVAGNELDQLWRLKQRINELESWLSTEPKVVEAARWLKEEEYPLGIEEFRRRFESRHGCKRLQPRPIKSDVGHRVLNNHPANRAVTLPPAEDENPIMRVQRENRITLRRDLRPHHPQRIHRDSGVHHAQPQEETPTREVPCESSFRNETCDNAPSSTED